MGDKQQEDTAERSSYIKWDAEELDRITDRILETLLDHPEYTGNQLLTVGQAVLPVHRRRNVQGFAAAKSLHECLKIKLANLKTQRDRICLLEAEKDSWGDTASKLRQEKKEVQAQLEIVQKEITTLKAEYENYKQKISGQPTPPKPEEIILSATAEQLLGSLFLRLGEAVGLVQSSVVERLERSIVTESDRLEKRVFKLETAVSSIAEEKGKNLPVPVAPAPRDVSSYMPEFAFVGGHRVDFQRLQASLFKSHIRLLRVDVSNLNQIKIPPHDRLVLWSKGISVELANSLAARTTSDKVIKLGYPLLELGPFLIREAEKIRQAKVNLELHPTVNGPR